MLHLGFCCLFVKRHLNNLTFIRGRELLSDKQFNHCDNLTALFYKVLCNIDRKILQTILQISMRLLNTFAALFIIH